MKRIAILGSTGSIGASTLRVAERHPDRFDVVALAARRSVDALADQARRHPRASVVLVDDGVESPDPSWRHGQEAVLELCERDDVDVVVNAVVGAAGLAATLRALAAGKRLALANKESLVAGGELVLEAARKGGGVLIPIDSEHSAILQCLGGYEADDVARIVLTASGGPFRGRSASQLRDVSPEDALRHPTWSMGAKITIDSATLANKALEVIEAHVLYQIDYDRIEVVVHPQSIVHSFVEFNDGSVLGQLGNPTMELPILIALSHPERVEDATLRTFDPITTSPLTFEAIDHQAFPMFGLGTSAGRLGGTAPAVFNAANEVAVEAFLAHRVGFREMASVVEATLSRMGAGSLTSIADVLEADAEAREVAASFIGTVPATSRSVPL